MHLFFFFKRSKHWQNNALGLIIYGKSIPFQMCNHLLRVTESVMFLLCRNILII